MHAQDDAPNRETDLKQSPKQQSMTALHMERNIAVGGRRQENCRIDPAEKPVGEAGDGSNMRLRGEIVSHSFIIRPVSGNRARQPVWEVWYRRDDLLLASVARYEVRTDALAEADRLNSKLVAEPSKDELRYADLEDAGFHLTMRQ